MTNLLSFVVILPGGKSKPLHLSIEVFFTRKRYGKPIVYYSPRYRKFRTDWCLPSKKRILRPYFITNTINDGQQDNGHREIL